MEVKNEKMSLQEATAKALYDQLDDSEEIRDVEGVVDDVLVITDPEITKDEYEEVIERAQEIVEDTPEGDIPFDDEYLGQYLQTCPICGSSFVEDHLLEPGATCPICLEQPEAFVVVGKIDSDDAIADELGIGDNIGDGVFDDGEMDMTDDEEIDVEPVPNTILNRTKEPEVKEEPIEEPEEEGPSRRETASKEIPAGNKLAESKVEETAVRDGADNINANARYNGDVTSLNGMLADKIADIAEELGDDYSEWLGEDDILEIIDTVVASKEWEHFDETLNQLIADLVEDKVAWIRKDDPASKYYDGDLSEFEENKKVEAHMPDYLVKDGASDIENACNIVEWLSTHNKNYTNDQYEAIISLEEILGKLKGTKVTEDVTEDFSEPVIVKFWETEIDRDEGLSEIYKTYPADKESISKAIADAKHIMHLMDYASVEVYNEDTEETYYWTDGVDEEYSDSTKASVLGESNKSELAELDRLQDELRGVDVSKLSDEEYKDFKAKSDRVHELMNKLYDFHKLGEGKTIIDNGEETYTIDKSAKTYTIKTPKGEKTFTFDEMDEFVNKGKGMNRMYKPMSVLAYTDYKNGNLNRWNTKKECL